MYIEETLSPNYSSRYGLRPTLQIVHATATPGWDSPFGWLRNGNVGDKRVSAHYLIGKDGRTALLVPEHLCAWHAGLSAWKHHQRLGNSLNAVSIGYELVNNNKGEPYPEPQLASLVYLLAKNAQRYAIPVTREYIVGHFEVSPGRKTDPFGLVLDDVVLRAQRKLGIAKESAERRVWRVRVTADVLNVRQGRATSFPIAGKLYRGDVVEVGDDTDGWLWLTSGWGFIAKQWTEPV